ncbi:hypothetical protein HK096_010999 [Nowakowskiella sp. JEL0078]|nr:hypothetical protein HK096_010999 [Nowakowskiella sp. JEL0078]
MAFDIGSTASSHSLQEALDIAFKEAEISAVKLHKFLSAEDCFVHEDEDHHMDLEDLLRDEYHSQTDLFGGHHVKHFIGKPHHLSVTAFDPETHDYMNEKGSVHSIETLGSLEGPGNRFLVFLNGCKARCLYCENPDTWEVKKTDNFMNIGNLVDRVSHYSPYYKNGGVTVSGGDPMVQFKFCASFLYAIHKHLGLHTCVETTGQTSRAAWNAVLPHADLVLLCVKGTRKETYKNITKTVGIDRMLDFIKELETRRIEWWCRYVIVPGYTDSDDEISGLIDICIPCKSLTRIEFLPYHTLGQHKWKNLGLEYPLGENPTPSKSDVIAIAQRIREQLKEKRPDILVTTGYE